MWESRAPRAYPGFGFLRMKACGDRGAFKIYGFIYTYVEPEPKMEGHTALTSTTNLASLLVTGFGFQHRSSMHPFSLHSSPLPHIHSFPHLMLFSSWELGDPSTYWDTASSSCGNIRGMFIPQSVSSAWHRERMLGFHLRLFWFSASTAAWYTNTSQTI